MVSGSLFSKGLYGIPLSAKVRHTACGCSIIITFTVTSPTSDRYAYCAIFPKISSIAILICIVVFISHSASSKIASTNSVTIGIFSIVAFTVNSFSPICFLYSKHNIVRSSNGSASPTNLSTSSFTAPKISFGVLLLFFFNI